MNTELIDIALSNSSPLIISKSLIGQADNLAEEHEQFNANYIVAGRHALYRLLGKIYTLSVELDGAIDKAEQISIMRSVLARKHGIRTQDNTPDLTVLVRYITRADRKTAHVYTRAIEAAKNNQISPLSLPEYLEEQGGIERVRANSVESFREEPSLDDLEERGDLTRRYLVARKEYPLASFTVNKKHVAELGGSSGIAVLLCTESKGRYFVLSRVPLDAKLEKTIVDAISRKFSEGLSQVRKNVDRFYKKAIKKREANTMKQMIRQRPKTAEVILRTKRISSFNPKGIYHD